MKSRLHRVPHVRLIGICAALLLAAFVGASVTARAMKNRIVSDISRSLGRPVTVSSVSIQLLPRPGLALANLTVRDFPEYGAEPILRCPSVSAGFRFSSLFFRGKLEVSRLSLESPSMNLARSLAGRWNLQDLLERADQASAAPTAKARLEKRAAFPYLEASGARINVKIGQEKKPYAFTEADFAMWKSSENEWSLRFKATPMRTDYNLGDTGTVTAEGSWKNTPSNETPVKFEIGWENAQLGQMSQLLKGSDLGWRGSLASRAVVSGTLAAMDIDSTFSVDDFRRFDVYTTSRLGLAGHCKGVFRSSDRTISSIRCTTPRSEGSVTLTGDVNVGDLRRSALHLTAEGIPAQSVLAFVRHAQPGVPTSMSSEGLLSGSISFGGTDGGFAGEGAIQSLTVTSRGDELAIGALPLKLQHAPCSDPKRGQPAPVGCEEHLEIGPAPLDLGKSAPAILRADLSPGGYRVSLQGAALVQDAIRAAKFAAIPLQPFHAEGGAKLDLHTEGTWRGEGDAKVLGEIQLSGVHATARGLNQAIAIASATIALQDDRTVVQKIAANFAGTTWTGNLQLPRPCKEPASCEARFDLRASELSIDALNRAVNPAMSDRPWYRFFSAADGRWLTKAHAKGRLTADILSVHDVAGDNFSASVEYSAGKLKVMNATARVLAGTFHGGFNADFRVSPPEYSGDGQFEDIDLAEVAGEKNEGLITGKASADYEISFAGASTGEMLSSASGKFNLKAEKGSFPHLILSSSPAPIHFTSLSGPIEVKDDGLALHGLLLKANEDFEVDGWISFARVLNLQLARNGVPAYEISGLPEEPEVIELNSSVPRDAQAALKGAESKQ